MARLMPLPLTVSFFRKIQIGFTFLVLAHLDSPRKRAVKRCVCVCVFIIIFGTLSFPIMAACRLHDISRRPTGWRRRCARAVGGGLETDPGGVTTAHQPCLVRSATADQSPSLGVVAARPPQPDQIRRHVRVATPDDCATRRRTFPEAASLPTPCD